MKATQMKATQMTRTRRADAMANSVHRQLVPFRQALLTGRAFDVLRETGVLPPDATPADGEQTLDELVASGVLERRIVSMSSPAMVIGYELSHCPPARARQESERMQREIRLLGATAM